MNRTHFTTTAAVLLALSAPPTLASIHFLSTTEWDHARSNGPKGQLVLDLGALESVQAAQTLARAWRFRLGPQPVIECWLTGASNDTLAQAATQLLKDGCTRVHLRR